MSKTAKNERAKEPIPNPAVNTVHVHTNTVHEENFVLDRLLFLLPAPKVPHLFPWIFPDLHDQLLPLIKPIRMFNPPPGLGSGLLDGPQTH